MNKIETLIKLDIQISKARQHLSSLETRAAELRLDTLQQVEMIRNAASTTLVFNGRRIRAQKNSHNRYRVTEGRTVLAAQYPAGIHDLRFDIAVGAL